MKWEYTVFTANTEGENDLIEFRARLDKFGGDGWELVSVVMPDHSPLLIVCLKRPKTDDKPAKAAKRT